MNIDFALWKTKMNGQKKGSQLTSLNSFKLKKQMRILFSVFLFFF